MDIFAYQDFSFPNGFLWGASTAGEQIEGNSKSYHDNPETAPKFTADGLPFQPPGIACNSYKMYREDVALLKQMNLSLYRCSIEWSRIEPEEGIYDPDALTYYINLLELLKKNGIKVSITLLHFACPSWLYKKGHFNSLDNLTYWEKHLEYIVPQIAPYIDYWNIINEMNLPFEYTVDQRLNLLHYHSMGYHIIKKYSNAPVSSAHSFSTKVPLRGSSDRFDNLMAQNEDWVCNEFFFHAIRTGEILSPYHDGIYLPELKNTCDYWSLNVYVRHMIDGRKSFPLTEHYRSNSIKPAGSDVSTDEILPEIMVEMLMRTRDKPCMISENGIAADDDRYRVVWLAAMLHGLREAMDLGAEVWGYSHWSLLDNWEWGSFDPRFGLASLDKETFARTLKPSGNFYANIAGKGGVCQEDLRKFLTGMPSVADK